ncbi:uncharacterized protein LOC5578310 [Aedes aegypti]|uniref:RAP domain-containing protein n=1 Tax=Aedes aegypti TaxID=7159 RepID=A0A1S4FZM3_AEDAE|nr:uncharacterized protein LOC5578310 [Aedes aegypti]
MHPSFLIRALSQRIRAPLANRFKCSGSQVSPVSRFLHTSGSVGAKKFSDTENDYAHGILQRQQVPVGATIAIQRFEGKQLDLAEVSDWKTCSTREVLDWFHRVVELCKQNGMCISDGRFDGFVEAMVGRMEELTDEEIVETLHLLAEVGPETAAVDTRNYMELWNAADRVCLGRVSRWDTEKLLYMADQWYPLRVAKIGRFVGKAMWKISTRLRKLPRDQLVKTVFYINLTRTPVENMIDIEFNLKNNFFDFEIDDISILCMGFFKTETPIRSVELIERIYQLTIHHAKDVKDISLAAILKLLRYSSRIPHASSMERLLSALIPEVPRLSLFCCLHLALLGSDIHLCHQASLEVIIERFTRDIKLLRLKDMERIAFIIGHFNMTIEDEKDRNLLMAIVDELPNRIQEITQYPKSYLSLLNFLTLKDIYSEPLISAAFEKRFLFMTYGRNVAGAGREVISLDAFLRINLKNVNYSGNYFPEKPFKVVAKLTQDYVPSTEYRLTKSDRMLLEIQKAFATRPNHFAHIIHLLPHFQRPDVLLLWDDDRKQFLDVAARCPEQYSGEILSRERLLGEDDARNGNLRLIAVVAGGWNCYVRNQNRVTGGFAMKLKQLGLVGFETVVIPWYEWPLDSLEAKEAYLFNRLNPLLDKR